MNTVETIAERAKLFVQHLIDGNVKAQKDMISYAISQKARIIHNYQEIGCTTAYNYFDILITIKKNLTCHTDVPLDELINMSLNSFYQSPYYESKLWINQHLWLEKLLLILPYLWKENMFDCIQKLYKEALVYRHPHDNNHPEVKAMLLKLADSFAHNALWNDDPKDYSLTIYNFEGIGGWKGYEFAEDRMHRGAFLCEVDWLYWKLCTAQIVRPFFDNTEEAYCYLDKDAVTKIVDTIHQLKAASDSKTNLPSLVHFIQIILNHISTVGTEVNEQGKYEAENIEKDADYIKWSTLTIDWLSSKLMLL